VIYMGVVTAEAIADKLVGDGLSGATPVAVVENASRPTMRVLRGQLESLGDLVARNRVKSPAVIIVGEVAREADAHLEDFAEQAA
jgi:uroporphyrin-III C-methyltransferase